MGDCIYCKKPVGFLRVKHMECVKKHEQGVNELMKILKNPLNPKKLLPDMVTQSRQIASDSYIDDKEYNQIVDRVWNACVEKVFEDGVLTEEEESRIKDIATAFNFTQDKLNTDPAFIKVVQGSILRDILNGEIPSKFSADADLPFNFKSGEKLIWVFTCSYSEMKVVKQFVGSSQGYSVRIAKGVYYRASAFKGMPIEKNIIAPVDAGLLAITDKSLYFAGSVKSFRIQYNKIITLMLYDNGVGIQREAQTAKPQIFDVGSGWFIYNLLSNLFRMNH